MPLTAYALKHRAELFKVPAPLVVATTRGAFHIGGLLHPNVSSGDNSNIADKKTIFFYTATQKNLLTFNDRLVWSYLVKSLRARNQGASKKEMQAWTRLGRQAVDSSIDALIAHGLAEQSSRYKIVAVEPDGDILGWWARRKTRRGNDHWADQFAYFPVGFSEKHRPIDSVLWGLLRSLAVGSIAKKQCYAGLAKMIGCKDYRTVSSCLQRLQQLKSIKIVGVSQNKFGKTDRFNILLLNHNSVLQNGEKASFAEPLSIKSGPNSQPDQSDDSEIPKLQPDAIKHIRTDRYYMTKMMTDRNYPRNVIEEVLDLANKLPTDTMFDWFQRNLSAAEQDHRNQQEAGKFANVRHSGRLMVYNMKRLVEKKRAEQRKFQEEYAYFDSLVYSA